MKLSIDQSKRAVLIILFVSLFVKLWCLFISGPLNEFPKEGTDGEFYYQGALNILEHGVYGAGDVPTVAMPPGQSFFFAVMIKLFGTSMLILKLSQIFLTVASNLIFYFTARRVSNPSVAFWAGLLLAIDPAQAYLSITFLSEPLFIFFMLFGIYLLTLEKKVLWIDLLISICFLAAGLTRNQGWLFPAFLFFLSLISAGKILSIKQAFFVVTIVVLLTSLWTYRNYRATGKLIFVSSEGGLTLWSGNNPKFRWRQPMPMSDPVYQRPEHLSAWEIDHYYKEKAMDWIVHHPKEFFFNGIRKLITLYHFNPSSSRSGVRILYAYVGLFPYGILLPLIFLGFITNLFNRNLILLLSYILFTSLLSVLFFGDSRMRAPIQPYLYLYGILGLNNCKRLVLWKLQTNEK